MTDKASEEYGYRQFLGSTAPQSGGRVLLVQSGAAVTNIPPSVSSPPFLTGSDNTSRSDGPLFTKNEDVVDTMMGNTSARTREFDGSSSEESQTKKRRGPESAAGSSASGMAIGTASVPMVVSIEETP